MPLFSYYCKTCDVSVEVLARDDESPNCPTCGADGLLKELSAFAPQTNSASDPVPAACGASQCCQAQGSCPFN